MLESINQYILKNWKSVFFATMSLLLYYAISFMIHPNSSYWNSLLEMPRLYFFAEITISFVFCLLISKASLLINSKLNKKLPWTDRTLHRALVQTGFQIVVIVLIIGFQIVTSFFLYGAECESDPACNFDNFLSWTTGSLVVALLISAINIGNFFLENWKKTALEAADLKFQSVQQKRAVAEAELHALKLQIDPHFIFNNLSVLSELILEDQQLGYNYSENFSKVYRYLLLNSKKDVILLSEEMKFLKSYIFLIQNRVGTGVEFDIELEPSQGNVFIPPMTLQFLVENALKHNSTLKGNPLLIKIYSDGVGNLVVENNIRPTHSEVNSSGIGLKNIVGRYALLSQSVPKIVNDDKKFKVILPLIAYEN